MRKINLKTAVILTIVLVVYCLVVGHAIAMNVYVNLKYTDDCQWYGYDDAHWTYSGIMCEKYTPLSKLDDLRDEWETRAK